MKSGTDKHKSMEGTEYAKLSLDYCKSLYKTNNTPKNIFLHVRIVNAIAKFLAEKLSNSGTKVSFALVDKGSLLHDLEKWTEIQNKSIRHSRLAHDKFAEMGYPKLAKVILNHDIDVISKGTSVLESVEEMIVFYSDKRTKHDQVVSIRERVDDLKKRYGEVSSITGLKLENLYPPLHEVEQKIFKNLQIKPEDITLETIKPYLIEDDY